jgi:uncharacterized protein YdhG (YjbR/CyaY superfamily)
MNDTKKATKSTTATKKRSQALTDWELAALKDTVQERKAAARRGRGADKRAAELQDALASIAEMPHADRVMAERLHALVQEAAPALSPKTWYGMPAYANEDGKVVCFFTPAVKFKSRYATFGFEEAAKLDEGNVWPTSFALKKLTPADEKKIAALVKRASS